MTTIITDSGLTITQSTENTEIKVQTMQHRQIGYVVVFSESESKRLAHPTTERTYKLIEGRPSARVAESWSHRLCVHARNLIDLFRDGKYEEIERYINYIKI